MQGEVLTHPIASQVAVQMGRSTDERRKDPSLLIAAALANMEGAMLLKKPPDDFLRFPEVVGIRPTMMRREPWSEMWEIRLPLASGSWYENSREGESEVPTPPHTWTVSRVAHAKRSLCLRRDGKRRLEW